MSNPVEEKNIMESPPISPLSGEPEPNNSKQLVECLPQFDFIADELVEFPPQSNPIADELVESPLQSDPIANELLESPPQSESDPIADENNEALSAEEGGQSEAGEVMMTPKKKRGRPRNYEVNEELVSAVPASNSEGSSKKAKGFPKGSGNKLQRLAANESGGAGNNFIPFAVTVQAGEDLLHKIWVMAQRDHQSICILSATGAVSKPVIRPNAAVGYVKYEGCYAIINLSGSFVYNAMYPHRKLGMITILLANPDNTVFGGSVLSGAPLIAASPIQLILGAFDQDIHEELNAKRRPSVASSTYTSVTAGPDLARIPAQVTPIQEVDRDGTRIQYRRISPYFNNSWDGTRVQYRPIPPYFNNSQVGTRVQFRPIPPYFNNSLP